jgi:hypothetical protein
MCACSVRTFRDGDEEDIVGLFNEVYREYGGFVPRTVEYWRWCCLMRPDVERGGVFLAFDGGRLCGYLVAGSSGNVWEFCVADGEREAVGALLGEAVRYLEGVGVSSVNVNVPNGACVVEGLREAGFGEVPAERMFVSTLSPWMLVSALVASKRAELLGRFDDEFAVRLHDVPYGVGKEFSVRVRCGTVEAVEGFSAGASVVVEMGFVDLLSVLFGVSGARRLLFAGKMRVKPFRKSGAFLRFLSALRLKGAWFFPLSDFG